MKTVAIDYGNTVGSLLYCGRRAQSPETSSEIKIMTADELQKIGYFADSPVEAVSLGNRLPLEVSCTQYRRCFALRYSAPLSAD